MLNYICIDKIYQKLSFRNCYRLRFVNKLYKDRFLSIFEIGSGISSGIAWKRIKYNKKRLLKDYEPYILLKLGYAIGKYGITEYFSDFLKLNQDKMYFRLLNYPYEMEDLVYFRPSFVKNYVKMYMKNKGEFVDMIRNCLWINNPNLARYMIDKRKDLITCDRRFIMSLPPRRYFYKYLIHHEKVKIPEDILQLCVGEGSFKTFKFLYENIEHTQDVNLLTIALNSKKLEISRYLMKEYSIEHEIVSEISLKFLEKLYDIIPKKDLYEIGKHLCEKNNYRLLKRFLIKSGINIDPGWLNFCIENNLEKTTKLLLDNCCQKIKGNEEENKRRIQK